MNTRLKLCKDCTSWEQSHNPEQGTCRIDEEQHDPFPTNYDSRCLFGLCVAVVVPDIKTINIEE